MWRYHHVFCCELDRINARLTTLNLLYLGLIALIPFPTGLIAEPGDESAAVIVYAITIALVTGMAAAMNLYAQRAGLTARRGRPIAHFWSCPACSSPQSRSRRSTRRPPCTRGSPSRC
jgi:uncharacterized membrane protein